MLLKVLPKTSHKIQIYRLEKKLAVGLIFQPWRLAVDRPCRPPTVKNLTVGASRSTARSTVPIQRANALWPVDHSVDRGKPYGRPFGRPPPPESWVLAVGRPLGRPDQVAGQRARPCVCRSTDLVDRLWVRSTGPVDRQSLAGLNKGFEN